LRFLVELDVAPRVEVSIVAQDKDVLACYRNPTTRSPNNTLYTHYARSLKSSESKQYSGINSSSKQSSFVWFPGQEKHTGVSFVTIDNRLK